MTNIDNLADMHRRRQPGRKVTGMAAMLLPLDSAGNIAFDAYAALFEETLSTGLTPAVNMDTGYANLLTADENRQMLTFARDVADGRPFIAGAFVEGLDGDVADNYRREVDAIVDHGGIPILFQTSRLHDVPASQVVDTYAQALVDVEKAYVFELGRMFAPNGEIWSDAVFEGMLSIPQVVGMKHSSLDRVRELERLATRDRLRPDFKILTGNDLGIDMIEYGSDYLLGLAAFSPAKFAERDRLWEAGDLEYIAVADALQHLGNIAFRPPVPAYKSSAATFLHLLGKIPTSRTHPRSPERPPWEAEIMRSCAERLGLI